MPDLQAQVAAELFLRSELLPREIEMWNKQSGQNQYGMGIHQSQVQAVTKLFEGMLKKQNGLKADLDPTKAVAMSPEEFTKKRLKLEQLLTGAHSIMATFRYIFSQRDATQPYHAILDAADLVAAYSYLPCMKLANRWKKEPDDRYREPPLIYLSAKLSPSAITRRHYFGLIGLELQGEMELKLPISVISLSYHDTEVFWALSSIYHEVGHILDQDLSLRAELGSALQTKLGLSERNDLWHNTWLGEMIADAFGVLLGGAGFAGALKGMLFKSREEVVDASGGSPHPNSYVRIFLLGALLHRTGVDELKALADNIEADWKRLYGPAPQWDFFVADCKTVAEVLLTEPLEALKQRCLLDFARNNAELQNSPDLKKDHEHMKAVASHLRGKNTTEFDGAITQPESLIRLVPAAAQLAAQDVSTDHQNKFAALHKGALELILYLQEKANVEFLADDPKAHEQYLDQLIEHLDFAALEIERN